MLHLTRKSQPSLQTQRVHVGLWYLLSAQRASHIPTLKPKYIPYTYMDPLGNLHPCALAWALSASLQTSPRSVFSSRRRHARPRQRTQVLSHSVWIDSLPAAQSFKSWPSTSAWRLQRGGVLSYESIRSD